MGLLACLLCMFCIMLCAKYSEAAFLSGIILIKKSGNNKKTGSKVKPAVRMFVDLS